MINYYLPGACQTIFGNESGERLMIYMSKILFYFNKTKKNVIHFFFCIISYRAKTLDH